MATFASIGLPSAVYLMLVPKNACVIIVECWRTLQFRFAAMLLVCFKTFSLFILMQRSIGILIMMFVLFFFLLSELALEVSAGVKDIRIILLHHSCYFLTTSVFLINPV